MISLFEEGRHTKPHFIFTIIRKADNREDISFHFQNLDALYQLFLNLAKNESFLNSIPLLTSCLAKDYHGMKILFFDENPFNQDI